ncbi:GumC family protein [Siphonobacter sp.]|uniref:GumC family protein n=1 Tax=Siphonobacter sp. TaxID=1869184 RepID=UPI003B3A3471
METPATAYEVYQVIDPEQSKLWTAVRRYLKSWPWFVLSVACALGLAYIYLLYQAPIYRAKASLLVKDEQKGAANDDMLKGLDIFGQQKLVDNEIEILKSYTLMDEVVDKLDLDIRYLVESNFGKREIYDLVPVHVVIERPSESIPSNPLQLTFPGDNRVAIDGVEYPLNKSVQTPYGKLRLIPAWTPLKAMPELEVHVLSREEVVENYLSQLTADTKSKQSTVIELSITDPVPAKAKAILNGLIEAYNAAAISDKNKTASNTLSFLDERLGLVSGELETVEKDVESYKSRHGITDLSVQAEKFLHGVQENDSRLNEINIQLGTLGDIERYLDSRGKDRSGAPSTLGLNDQVLLGLIGQVSELELKREQLLRTSNEMNPLLQIMESQIRNVKANIRDNVQTMRTMLVTSKSQMLATNSKMERVLRGIPRKERLLLDISRQQAIKNDLYTFLLKKREETAVTHAATIADSRTVDAARSGKLPIQPVKRNVYMAFALLGFLLPIGFIYGRDSVNNRVMQRNDVEGLTQIPILGEVVNSKGGGGLVIADRSVLSEQIRSLRTNLQFLKSATDSQVLLFTSSISGEGKSFVSLNLGASLALVNYPTVILEMDLRRPQLQKSLDLNHTVGISNYLIEEATLDDVLYEIPGYTNYYIIPSGPIPPNPSELLSSPRLKQLFDELRQRFTHILVDSPPIGLVTDAQLIATYADATMYLVRQDVTPKTYLKTLDTLYREQRFQKLNIILNGMGKNKRDSAYYQYAYSPKELQKLS